ncbi:MULTISPECIES: antibiotic biosynthesis monooxygenase family protein [unclassified Streptomyces]|uniref:antibiotic biosynthesis monooxygenase family protein n=1 Tax=unclassified Streptomyces TaxID=2593676 RepID=UPI002253B510|nr:MULTISPECIES: antibiotic biosynthesis monooxygenase family protein [unclassified Streptomyces]WSP59536.1 antibiotic biosynthesis monooxygenase [Streptomyces sp. NBC_01241]WSU19948.1 antibiotic biosynthesis monooxygenase [Streptomyces sp. NBC_01108]MCX4791321.1 antibiotic biosynthesis monooxygenase [Streptomyces sp. NBC_01221]MCX4792969.1 antibiotic biosynthesis monooxygenase [Streptomyces sp. NBC_01242]WSP60868.1 antibiotic biosynthesis monooxygenase [Streptomyces sp. NBC_01240]
MRTAQNGDPADRLSVVYTVHVVEGGEQGFLDAYERIRKSVASVPGHIIERLGEPVDDSRQWVIASEWETPEHFFAWQQGEDHRELLAPLRDWVDQTQSLRYRVIRETVGVPS